MNSNILYNIFPNRMPHNAAKLTYCTKALKIHLYLLTIYHYFQEFIIQYFFRRIEITLILSFPACFRDVFIFHIHLFPE